MPAIVLVTSRCCTLAVGSCVCSRLRLTSRKPLCGWTCNQLTSKVNGGITGSRFRWSTQLSHSVRPHNPAARFQPPSATVVSAEPFSHGTGTLRCLQKEMATYRHWSVSSWWDPDDVPHCRILSHDKTGGLSRLHSLDENAVLWLTNYGLWHAYKKKIAADVDGRQVAIEAMLSNQCWVVMCCR